MCELRVLYFGFLMSTHSSYFQTWIHIDSKGVFNMSASNISDIKDKGTSLHCSCTRKKMDP